LQIALPDGRKLTREVDRSRADPVATVQLAE